MEGLVGGVATNSHQLRELVEDEVEVLGGIEENPLSLLRFALFSLFDPRRTANVE